LVTTIQHRRAERSALLQQARALRAAIPRQASAAIADLMNGEAERLEAMAEDCERGSADCLERRVEA
jgi:hypothetical protein